MMRENPAYSRMDGYNYITCFVCDSELRNELRISHASIIPLGSVVGAASRPVHQANIGGNNQARGFGTNVAQPLPQAQNRQNWFNNANNNNSNDDDNQQPPPGPAPARWGNQNTNATNQNKSGWNNNNQNQRPSNSSSIRCNCNEPTLRLVCKKEGPNQNRSFLKCAKSTCRFFQWDDQPANQPRNNSSFGNNSRGGGGAGRGGGGGGSRAPRKCGICRGTGHTRITCPNNANN